MFGTELFIKALEALESKALHINPRQCSRFRHQLSKCRLCSEHCPTGAISWSESLSIDVDKCTGCGICTNVCPNGVFEANNPSNDALLSRVITGLKSFDQIAFVCPKHQQEVDPSIIQSGNILIVPCLGRIDEPLLVGCASIGANSVWLVDGRCSECNYRARDIIQQTTARANKILDIFGITDRIQISPDIPEWSTKKEQTAPRHSSDSDTERYSRRNFFKAMTQKTKRAAILAAGSIIDNDTTDNKTNIRKSGLPLYLPKKRVLLLESIKKLGRPVSSTINVKNLPFWQIKIDDNCTGCGMCAYFCPTGALKKTEDEDKTTITFQLSNCTKCDLCREVCYKEAISALPDINSKKLLHDEKDILFVSDAGRANPKEPREILGL